MSRQYKAFISYSWADKEWAGWLHRTLETYRPPKGAGDGKTLHPIFKDREEEAAGGGIGAAFVFALTDYLGQFTQRYVLIVGLIFIVTILLAPKGSVGVLMEAWRPAGESTKEDAS